MVDQVSLALAAQALAAQALAAQGAAVVPHDAGLVHRMSSEGLIKSCGCTVEYILHSSSLRAE